MTKHYIRLNNRNLIIKGFSDDFEQSKDSDICINENGGRQFKLEEKINPQLTNDKGTYIYKYENEKVLQRTPEEIQADEVALPANSKSELQVLKETVDMLILSSLGGN